MPLFCLLLLLLLLFTFWNDCNGSEQSSTPGTCNEPLRVCTYSIDQRWKVRWADNGQKRLGGWCCCQPWCQRSHTWFLLDSTAWIIQQSGQQEGQQRQHTVQMCSWFSEPLSQQQQQQQQTLNTYWLYTHCLSSNVFLDWFIALNTRKRGRSSLVVLELAREAVVTLAHFGACREHFFLCAFYLEAAAAAAAVTVLKLIWGRIAQQLC